METATFRHLNEYFKEKFGGRVLKICVDGGFTCPNRDGIKSIGGCIFCSEKGSGDHLERKPVKKQVYDFLDSYKGDRADKFIVYFQNFTSTYDTSENLKKIYDEALIDERIVGIDIATRPDCIDENICKLLSSYKDKYAVSVELGLQTADENTHNLINQKITNDEFLKAVRLLNEYGIDVIVHIMVGLPFENHHSIVNTMNFLKDVNFQGIKIHSVYVVKGTALEKMYLNGEYSPIDYEDYLNELIYILKHLRKDVVVHRVTGDPPKDNFVAPLWALNKKNILNSLDRIMLNEGISQGCEFH